MSAVLADPIRQQTYCALSVLIRERTDQYRKRAYISSMTLTAGFIAEAALISMLARISGSVTRSSSRVGIVSPAIKSVLWKSRQYNW